MDMTLRICVSALRSLISRRSRRTVTSVYLRVQESGRRVRGILVSDAADKFSERPRWPYSDGGRSAQKVSSGSSLILLEHGPGRCKNLSDVAENICKSLSAKPGDLALISADSFEITCKTLHALRKHLGKELELYDEDTMHVSWVIDFPMFARDEETGNWAAMHHPFTAPHPEDIEKLTSNPKRAVQLPGPCDQWF